MRKLIEYTLVAADGVFDDPVALRSGDYYEDHYLLDDAYVRDVLGLLMACDALLLGRSTYAAFAQLWPGRDHPWADRINGMRKHVFSSTLATAEWNNTTIVRGDAVAEVARLKQQPGGDLLMFGHGRFAETLLRAGLVDLVDLSIHPVLLGRGKQFFRAGQTARLKLVATKTFAKIVKVTYAPQYGADPARAPA